MDTIRKIADVLTKDGDKTLERVNEVTESAWQKGRATLKDWGGQGQDALDAAKKESQKAWEDAGEFLKKHPTKAVGLAIVVGVFIGGTLMAMRKSN